MSETPTPRTDAAKVVFSSVFDNTTTEFVPLKEAEQMERELAAAREELSALLEIIQTCKATQKQQQEEFEQQHLYCESAGRRFGWIVCNLILNEHQQWIDAFLDEKTTPKETTLRAENLRYRTALERIRDTSVAMLDSLRCHPKGGTVILAEGPGRIRDAACDALHPANA